MTMIATVAWAATGTVNTQDLNMREGASTSKNVIKQLAKGTEVNILSEEGEWYSAAQPICRTQSILRLPILRTLPTLKNSCRQSI